MLGSRIVKSKKHKDEGEKPFWISYADLMTALMMLFLVVMSVSLIVVNQKIDEKNQIEKERIARFEGRIKEIKNLCNEIHQIANSTSDFNNIKVDCVNNRIDFGTQALFDFGKYNLSKNAEIALRSFVPEILKIANSETGQKWLKRIVVEGFTDNRGAYLLNLNLSLQRAQQVLCALFHAPLPEEHPLTDTQKIEIQKLFLVGGFSFNSAKANHAESRRVELRMEFYGLDETHPNYPSFNNQIGNCQIK
ncbi:MAG: OmpA family protein [SAR324 cluster bacterium]|nr:OmpA family protein [SAR324 cluster bacterium]